ncbi:MAG: Wzz/FepE/Etk N-terminal domain-containing protein [Anaerolineae bacterium]
MEIRDYLRILRKRGWILIVIAALAAVGAFGFSQLQPPVYRASIKLSVEPARYDWGLSNTVKDILRNYVLNLRTHKMAQRVIDRAQLDMNTYQFLERVTISSDSSNFSLQIDAESRSPEEAKLMAQTLAQVFVEDRERWNQEQDKRDRIDVKIVDDVRDAPQIRPKPLFNALAAGLLGLLVGGVIVFVLEWMEADILRSPESVERALGIPVLGAIPGQQEEGARRAHARRGRASVTQPTS